MTLMELLNKEVLRDLTVINSRADLEREVGTIEQTETPDVISYVPINTFLITTAMVYQNNQDSLCDLIRHLNDMPCAGLGIKLGRFVHELDQSVIDTADELHFPLIKIPMERTLGSVYHDLLSVIWETENRELLHVLNIRKKFYDLIIHGISLKRLLLMLGTTIGKHVLIIDRFGEICGTCHTTGWEEQISIELIHNIDKDSAENERQNFISQDNGNEISALLYPIKSVSRKTHFLIVFETEKRSAISSFVMEEIVMILSMHFYKKLYNDYNEMQSRENFIKLILETNQGELWTSKQILTLGKEVGVKQSSSYQILAGCFRKQEPQKFNATHFMRKEEKYILIFQYLDRKLKSCFQDDILLFPDFDNWRYIFLIQQKETKLRPKLKELREAIENAFGDQMIFAYGSNVYNVLSIVHSYWESADVINHLPEGQEEYIYTYQPKNIMELLKGISGNQIDEVCKQMLKDLSFPQDETNSDLKKTLRAYLDCRCSIMETANRLYLHRNTVRYRIKKCEEILQHNLDDTDYCFQLQLCLILSDMK